MTESKNKPQSGNAQDTEASCHPALTRALVASATTIAIALGAIVGLSAAYCDSAGGALFWSFFVTFGMPVGAFLDAPGEVVMLLVAYVVTVLALARWWPIKFNLSIAVLAVVTSGLFSAAITSYLTNRHPCIPI